jgi:acyl-CoA thioester hydrolase
VARHLFDCHLRWGDMDAYGHVNNVAFLSYLEEARVDMLFVDARDHGASRLADGVIVVRHEIDYRRPLDFRPEPVRIETWVTAINNASFRLAYDICDDAAVYATAATTLAPFDLERQRLRRLLPEDKAILAKYVDESSSSS